ncbi:MAG: hypothetical protein IKK43_03480 [Clostridia bacterium]|nr:hypothetical protein [Clostridia bacterium]
MFKLKFAKTYDFAIMSKHNLEHVLEDYFTVSENAFCVADGVTRDLKDGTPIVYPETYEQAVELIQKYPNPSGATAAAKICAEGFVSLASSLSTVLEITNAHIMNVLKTVNSEIATLNKNRKIDYVKNDYYACVAVGGIFVDNMLWCFAIGDSTIRILDKDYNIVFDSSATNTALVPYKPSLFLKLRRGTWTWNNAKYRKFWRKRVRNNTWRLFTGKYTFGALTGEKKAIPFIKTYSINLDNAKYILAYSDGCEECLRTKEQMISVIANPEQIKEETHEKTLLIYEKE